MSTFEDSVRFNFLYVDKYSFGRTWVYPESVIPYSMLRYIVEGSAEFTVDNQTYIVEKDQIAYLPEGSRLSCRALDDNFSFISIRFKASVYYEGTDFLMNYYNFPRTVNGDELLKSLFYDVYKWVFTDSPARMLYISGSLTLIIANIISKVDKRSILKKRLERNSLEYNFEEIKRRSKKSNVKEDPRISVVTDYIIMHPTEKYTAETLSKMADVSETTFRRLFKEQTGKTPTDFIREIRLTTAARKLLVSNEMVSIIAYEVGFENSNYFVRTFKQAFGMTPNQYRKSAVE